MNKYFKILFTVLMISISITSCRDYFQENYEIFTDFKAVVYKNEVLLMWEMDKYANSGETLCLSTSENPTINDTNSIRVEANNKLNRNRGWWICYNANVYHIHDLDAPNVYDGNDPSSLRYCENHYNYNGFQIYEYREGAGYPGTSSCAIVEDLMPKTTYYARVHTTVKGNDAYSEQISFTTK